MLFMIIAKKRYHIDVTVMFTYCLLYMAKLWTKASCLVSVTSMTKKQLKRQVSLSAAL